MRSSGFPRVGMPVVLVVRSQVPKLPVVSRGVPVLLIVRGRVPVLPVARCWASILPIMRSRAPVFPVTSCWAAKFPFSRCWVAKLSVTSHRAAVLFVVIVLFPNERARSSVRRSRELISRVFTPFIVGMVLGIVVSSIIVEIVFVSWSWDRP